MNYYHRTQPQEKLFFQKMVVYGLQCIVFVDVLDCLGASQKLNIQLSMILMRHGIHVVWSEAEFEGSKSKSETLTFR